MDRKADGALSWNGPGLYQGCGIVLRAGAFRALGIPVRVSESVAASSGELASDLCHHLKKSAP